MGPERRVPGSYARLQCHQGVVLAQHFGIGPDRPVLRISRPLRMSLGCGTDAALWRKPWMRRSLLKIVVVLFVADAAVGAANGGHVLRIIIVRVLRHSRDWTLGEDPPLPPPCSWLVGRCAGENSPNESAIVKTAFSSCCGVPGGRARFRCGSPGRKRNETAAARGKQHY